MEHSAIQSKQDIRFEIDPLETVQFSNRFSNLSLLHSVHFIHARNPNRSFDFGKTLLYQYTASFIYT
uniref:Uncharacterized protein n=1 Tax=Utricularia reniformis TaxID=192314 RepID=A0A1Y0AZA0_9LAMI|nr:hypothetical protein AEK19_MT0176 [Utricularia reniformis]ART30458.1 hypothetical protein AEK19_MT0176 [Utricularia reniformis]